VKPTALAALLALVPVATSADTQDSLSFPRARIPHLYIKQGTSIDVALPLHESLTSNPIVADPRWSIVSAVNAGNVVHLVIKPTLGATEQLVTIPAVDQYNNDKTMHMLLDSGQKESTAYTVSFTSSMPSVAAASWTMPRVPYHPAPSVTPAELRHDPPSRTLSVKSCAAPLDAKYHWSGDRRIDVWQTCDDGKHVFVLMREGRNPPGAVLYRVDPGGKQDQLMNSSFVPGAGDRPPQWVADGTPNRMALAADSTRGQMRVNIDYVGSGVAR
jgi:hypothetical protein